MTERIYYTEPFRTEFDAVVTAIAEHDGRRRVLLDRTAFYPTSGGQPFDTGTLNGIRVQEVVEREDGAIEHLIDGRLDRGDQVHGVVDWPRRFEHMQQHTGQHILSAAFDRLHRARTVGFHLGAITSTLDLDRDLGTEAIAAAEAEANRVVWEDRPVTIRFASDEEAAGLPLRKEPGRSGTLRLIEVDDFDLSACGGTHVARTGAVGIVAVKSFERFRGGTRVEFVCGGRALAWLRTLRDAISGSLRYLSVLPEELPAAIERAQAESKDLRRVIKGLQEKLAGHEAEALAGRAREAGGRRQVVEAVEGWDAGGLKVLALAVAARPGHVVALFSTTGPALVVIARAPDVPVDAAAALRALIQRFGGKGGGKADLAQGGGLNGEISTILDAARELLASQ